MDALDLADRPVSQLSGGERQRVFLARAFAQEAALLCWTSPPPRSTLPSSKSW